MICSTLTGIVAIKHSEVGILVREDGFVFNKHSGNHRIPTWSKGTLHKAKPYKRSHDTYRTTVNNKSYQVHRLVAECFIPNPEHKPTVDHRNRDSTDNRVSNLRWATYKEQVENSSKVIDRTDYGVRPCEDPVEYHKQWYNKRGKQIRDKDKDRENSKRYYQSHREQNREKCRKYHEEHREEIKAKQREYCQKHREEIKARRHEHYLKHREELKEKSRLARAAKRRVTT